MTNEPEFDHAALIERLRAWLFDDVDAADGPSSRTDRLSTVEDRDASTVWHHRDK